MKKIIKFIGIAILSVTLAKLLSTSYTQRATIKELEEAKKLKEKELVEICDDVKGLEDDLANADSLEFVEKLAREKLRMVGPNDLIYVHTEADKKDN